MEIGVVRRVRKAEEEAPVGSTSGGGAMGANKLLRTERSDASVVDAVGDPDAGSSDARGVGR